METFSLTLKVVTLLTVWSRAGECRQTGSLHLKICSCLAKLLSYSRSAFFCQQNTVVLSVFLHLYCEMMSGKTFFRCLRKMLLQAIRENWGSSKIQEEREKQMYMFRRDWEWERILPFWTVVGELRTKTVGIGGIFEARVFRHFICLKVFRLPSWPAVSYLSSSDNARTELVRQVDLAGWL